LFSPSRTSLLPRTLPLPELPPADDHEAWVQSHQREGRASGRNPGSVSWTDVSRDRVLGQIKLHVSTSTFCPHFRRSAPMPRKRSCRPERFHFHIDAKGFSARRMDLHFLLDSFQAFAVGMMPASCPVSAHGACILPQPGARALLRQPCEGSL